MTGVAEAEALILERMPTLPSETRALRDAIGAVLREPVSAERDQPPFDRVTMDGIAIQFDDWNTGRRRYRSIGTQAAGAAAINAQGDGDCVEIMTGAVLPLGTDTIIPVERLTQEGDDMVVENDAPVTEGQFVHRQGSDRAAGSLLLDAGQSIGSPEMAVLASAGCAEIEVTRAPRVGVVSTGDELVDVDESSIEPYQIRSSNDRAIEASLIRNAEAAVTRTTLRDDPDVILNAIARLHDENDALILSGGVSMGQYDFVPSVLDTLGVELVFHRIEQRPGRPMWFGVSKGSIPVFALPGNPVSTLVCLRRYVVPALQKMRGLSPQMEEIVVLGADVEFAADLSYFLPVILRSGGNGSSIAEPRPTNTSGDFVSLAGTDGFVELPRGENQFPAGTAARMFRW